MALLEDLKEAADFEVTSAQNAALARLRSNPDFNVLLDLLTRWNLKAAFDLLRDPHDAQAASLLARQGGYQLLKKIVSLIDEAPVPPAPRNRKDES